MREELIVSQESNNVGVKVTKDGDGYKFALCTNLRNGNYHSFPVDVVMLAVIENVTNIVFDKIKQRNKYKPTENTVTNYQQLCGEIQHLRCESCFGSGTNKENTVLYTCEKCYGTGWNDGSELKKLITV